MRRHGEIVIVTDLVDPMGRNPKDRPRVIVTPSDRIAEGGPVDVVAITSKLPEPLPIDHVRLPWTPRRSARTGLRKPNAAVCSWVVEVEDSRIDRVIGHVPDKELLQIAILLQTLP